MKVVMSKEKNLDREISHMQSKQGSSYFISAVSVVVYGTIFLSRIEGIRKEMARIDKINVGHRGRKPVK